MNFFWSYQDLQDPGAPIAHIGHQYATALVSNPSTVSLNVASGSKLLIVCINAVVTKREAGAPTWNGVSMTSVGSSDGTHNSEMWYLLNPDSGTHNLVIPNSGTVNLQMVASWYSCSNDLSLYGFERYSGNSGTIGGNIDLPLNKEVLIVAGMTLIYYATLPKISFIGLTDLTLYYGTTGAVFGSGSQYKTYLNTGDTFHYMGWEITNTSWPWDDIIAVFSK